MNADVDLPCRRPKEIVFLFEKDNYAHLPRRIGVAVQQPAEIIFAGRFS